MSDSDTSLESKQPSISPDDIKEAWQEDANDIPAPETQESEESEVETEENEEAEHTDDAESQVKVAEPIILRKQKQKLTQQVRRLESEIASMRNQMQQPHAIPETSQEFESPVDENTVEGQVWKAFNKLAAVEQKKQAEVRARNAQADQARQYQALQEELDSGVEMYDDFDEVVLDNSVPITPAMRDAALMLPNARDVFYTICKNPAELKRIGSLHPLEQAREMIKVSAQVMNQGNQKKPAVPARTMTTLKNNPVKRSTSSREITDRSSVAEIRAHLRSGKR